MIFIMPALWWHFQDTDDKELMIINQVPEDIFLWWARNAFFSTIFINISSSPHLGQLQASRSSCQGAVYRVQRVAAHLVTPSTACHFSRSSSTKLGSSIGRNISEISHYSWALSVQTGASGQLSLAPQLATQMLLYHILIFAHWKCKYISRIVDKTKTIKQFWLYHQISLLFVWSSDLNSSLMNPWIPPAPGSPAPCTPCTPCYICWALPGPTVSWPTRPLTSLPDRVGLAS